MKNKIFLLTGIITASTFFSSCSKDDDSTNDSEALIPTVEVTTAKQYKSIEEATNTINELSQNSFGDFNDRSSKIFRLKMADDCASIEENISDDDFNSGTASIDFGDGCELEDGTTITGKILMSFVYEDTEDGVLITSTQTMENITFDDMSVSGTSTMTILTPDFDFFDTTISELETGIKFTSTFSFEWEDGLTASIEETMEITELFNFSSFGGTITTTGSGKATFNNGDVYTFTISSPIHIDIECGYPSSGIIIDTENTSATTIDFGDGTCDNVATKIDSEGNETTIDLDAEEVLI